MIPESHSTLLAWGTRAIAHVATLGPAGEPQCNPMWFDWDGTHIAFALKTDRQKYRNLKRDKRIAVSITDPSNPYRYLELRGELAFVEPDNEISFVSRLAKKYTNSDRFLYHKEGDQRVVVYVRPTYVTSMG